MKIIDTPLPGVKLIEPVVHDDERGFFMESYQTQRYQDAGIAHEFVQDNVSRSAKGTLRGLHYQLHHPQGKLVMVVTGEVYDVAVDIRKGSPTFGQWYGAYLSADNHHQMYVPPGYAHGYCVISGYADFLYKCTDYYHPDDEYCVLWSDPVLAIDWPLSSPTLSVKDSQAPRLGDVNEDLLPVYSSS